MMSFRTFVVKKNYITEAAGRLDTSITNADKAFTQKVKFFFVLDRSGNTLSPREYTIEEKFDGVKLNLFRNDEDFDPKDFSKNWVVSYKNSIMHPDEFKSVSSKKSKEQGIGITQYRLVFDHLRKYHRHAKDIPKNTEFFIEYMMKKPSLTRKYETNHSMVLIGYAHNRKIEKKSDFRLYLDPSKLENKQNTHYAEMLGIESGAVVFEGTIDSYNDLHSGAKNKSLKSAISKNKKFLQKLYKDRNWEELYNLIKEIFLEVKSVYGGKTEGVVIKDHLTKKVFKFLQDDQHDRDKRIEVKSDYRMDREKENEYYIKLREIATEILNDLDLSKPFGEVIKAISAKVHGYKLPAKIHSKKSLHQVREDLHLTTKMKFEKLKEGWAGVVGKFRIVTKEHVNMIESAFDKGYKGVTVMIVAGSRDPELAEASKKILQEIFKGKSIEFVIAKSGHIVSLENKTRNPIVAYICGPDREQDYEKQLKSVNSDAVVDVYDGGKRGEISATQAEEALKNNNYGKLAKIVHEVTLKQIDKWSKFIKR